MHEYQTLIFFIYSIVVFLAFTLSIVYLKVNYRTTLHSWLIFIVFICIGYIHLIHYLFLNRDIIYVPHLLRTGPIAGYIAVPFFYLVVLKKITNTSFRWSDALHGIPVLLYIVNYIPLFLQSSRYKLELINHIFANKDYSNYNEGWLLTGQNVIMMRTIQLALYVILSFILIYKFKKQKNPKIHLKHLLNWYFGYIVSVLLASVLFVFGVLSDYGLYSVHNVYFTIALVFLIIFFFNPRMMYSKYFDSIDSDVLYKKCGESVLEPLNNLTKEDIKNSKQRLIMAKIEKYLDEFKPYLHDDFSLGNLEKGTGISSKQISLSIKGQYDLNFTQYINKRRIDYLISRLKEDVDLRNCSVEELSLRAGFSSPNNFYAYFKNHTGQTPRKFIDETSIEPKTNL